MNIITVMIVGVLQTLSSSVNTPCIQVVPSGSTESYWLQVKRGAESAGKKYGYSIYFRGPKISNDARGQLRIVGIKKHLGCKALVLAPSANYDKHIEDFKKAGIPVVFIDRGSGDTNLVSLVATDNYNAGFQAGVFMAEKLGYHGRVLVIRLKKGISSTDLRESGFIDAAQSRGLEVVLAPYVGNSGVDSRLIIRDILYKYSRDVVGIFSPNESTSSNLLFALEHSSYKNNMAIVGFDINQRLLDGLKRGVFNALVVQKPFLIGYVGVEVSVNKINGLDVDRFIDTGHAIISSDNLTSAKIKAELSINYPDLIFH